MLLDAAKARLELADRNPVTNNNGMILDNRAPEAHDLVAELFAARVDLGVCGQDIGSDVGPKRMNVGLEIGSGFRDIGANVAQTFQGLRFTGTQAYFPFYLEQACGVSRLSP